MSLATNDPSTWLNKEMLSFLKGWVSLRTVPLAGGVLLLLCHCSEGCVTWQLGRWLWKASVGQMHRPG